MATFLEQEIDSQPDVVARLLDREVERVSRIAARLPHFDYALIAARGTSDHAATYAKYAWGALGGRPVALATPSLYTLYGTPPRLGNALVVGISQSGQSPDIVGVLEDGRRQGRPTLAITNDGSSPLAAAADDVIELHAGAEQSVAATKTYVAQLVVAAMLAAVWSEQPARLAELQRLPAALADTLAAVSGATPLAQRLREAEQCLVLGRGFNFATALELALKLKELTYLPASAYSSADFRHGPIATVTAGLPTILVMPSGAALDDMLDMARDLQARGADLVLISDAPAERLPNGTLLPLPAPLPEWLSPVAAIVPGQVLALRLTIARGGDPDHPRGLHKVTLTR
jgi:glucosamine--fructose-6-phosphate aminotransferase (isomerizing)